MQTMTMNLGSITTLRNMIQTEGVRGLWMGNGTNAIKNVPQGMIMFFTYQTLKSFYKDPDNPQMGERLFAGAAAGFNQLFFVYPLELIKTRMALCPKGTYRSILHCADQVRLHEGWRALFNGLCPSIYANVGYLGGQLVMFDLIKDFHNSRFESTPHPSVLYLYGLLSQVLPIATVYPFFVVKNRMQLQGYAGTEVLYSSMRSCFKSILQKEGFFGLYKGILPYCIKIVPGGAINLAVYDWTKDFLVDRFRASPWQSVDLPMERLSSSGGGA
jgi:solute carrier family 25 phosphate transporter 23/24/25/41